MLIKSRRGDYEVPHLMRWRERQPQPTFDRSPLVGPTTKVATIGSCFAERVVEVLSGRGVDATFHPAGLQYNTASIAQEFAHLFGDSPYRDDDVVRGADGRWEHVFRKELRGDSRDEVLEAQRACDEQARAAYRGADVIAITLGLTEVWERVADGLIAVELPPQPVHAAGDYRFRNLTTAENIDNLGRIVDLLQAATTAKILLTVSPVPLHATFRDADVTVANCASKSRLRAAVDDFLLARPEVAYFHSYEIVTQHEGPGSFFLEDGRHVSPDGVAFIMNEFLRQYGDGPFAVDHIPFGQVPKPDQTVGKRLSNLRSRVAKTARKARGRAD